MPLFRSFFSVGPALGLVFGLIVCQSELGLSAELLLEHSPRPLQAEGSREALEPWETPIEGFFVRSHHSVPAMPEHSESSWILKVDGLVEKPLILKFSDLKRFPQKKLHAVLECSGNGRSQQKPSAPGVQWKRGAVGNAEWGGVSFSEILARVKLKANARFATFEGADRPVMPGTPAFVRSISLEKLRQEDTLLATAMNREPLPIAHGGPLRLIVPGWYGENWMKWVTHVTFTDKEDSGFFMKKAYRIPKVPVKPEEAWDSSTGVAIEELLVQSLIVSPGEGQTVGMGTIAVRGKAFSGGGPITQVEISIDRGKSWRLAKVEPVRPSGGWQEFSADVEARAKGPLAIVSRAKDQSGNQQPLEAVWNPGGYVRNSVDSVTIQVVEKDAVVGSSIVKRRCYTCHAQELIESQRLTPQQWTGVLKKMEGFGVTLNPEENSAVLNYLSQFSPEKHPQVPRPLKEHSYVKVFGGDSKKGAALFQRNCAACHGQNGEGKIGPLLTGRTIPGFDFVQTVLDGRGNMPPFKSVLNSKNIKDIQSFLSGGPRKGSVGPK